MNRQLTIAVCTLTTIGLLAGWRPAVVNGQKKGATLVEDVNRPGGQAYHANATIIVPGGTGGVVGFAPEPIPADKRLVIEFASAVVAVPLGQRGSVSVYDTLDGAAFPYAIPLTLDEATAQFQAYIASQPLKIYVDGNGVNGPSVACNRAGSSAGTASCSVYISGYLVDK